MPFLQICRSGSRSVDSIFFRLDSVTCSRSLDAFDILHTFRKFRQYHEIYFLKMITEGGMKHGEILILLVLMFQLAGMSMPAIT